MLGLCEWGVNLRGRLSWGHVTSPTGTLVAIATTLCSRVSVHYFRTLVAMEAAAQMLMEFGVWQIQSFMKMSGTEPNPINSSSSFYWLIFHAMEYSRISQGGETLPMWIFFFCHQWHDSVPGPNRFNKRNMSLKKYKKSICIYLVHTLQLSLLSDLICTFLLSWVWWMVENSQ